MREREVLGLAESAASPGQGEPSDQDEQDVCSHQTRPRRDCNFEESLVSATPVAAARVTHSCASYQSSIHLQWSYLTF